MPVSSPERRHASWLPADYRILPESGPFHVPGFEGQASPTSFVLTPEPIECTAWFERFAVRVREAVGRRYLPVCRMSDGEFLLLFGFQPPSVRHTVSRRLKIRVLQSLEMVRHRLGGFRAHTAPGVSSGAMSYAERQALVPVLSSQFADIARNGILGLHLSYGSTPFQEQYFPPLGRWLKENAVTLTIDNYVPFYFVYGLLRGPRFRELIGGRRVLVVNSATAAKREAITRTLLAEGAQHVEWLTISATRSFADRLDLSHLHDTPDICLLGAGVGKAALFSQLERLGIPCVDAGYAFEVWADPQKQWHRPYMVPTACQPQVP
jgi:hypothetical protein